MRPTSVRLHQGSETPVVGGDDDGLAFPPRDRGNGRGRRAVWRNTSSPRVPDPEAALDEFARVTKAGGEIILVNHLGAEAGPRRVFEQSFAPVARRLGWRPEFRWQRLARWAERHGGVRLLERRPMPPLGHFSLIRFGRLSAGADGRGRAGAAKMGGRQRA